MKIVIVSYKAGNTQSVLFSLERLGCEAVVSSDAQQIISADKVIFPGVGEASSAMRELKSSRLDFVIPKLEQPVLGICLGMQLLCSHTEEGNTSGLSVFPVQVKKFIPADLQTKVPQMGWNTIQKLRGPLFASVPDSTHVYYVHSYYAELSAYTSAETDYILPYSGSLQKDNFHAVQFHPEKSGAAGEHILRNFLSL
jgi:imidazole glycerol-phosphate synthase subunit HisH